jgi:hypothetical protein
MDRFAKLAALLAVLGHSQHRATSARTRQMIFAFSTAFLGVAVLAVVGASASEPLEHPAPFAQSKDPPPLLLRPLPRSAAIALNESIGFSQDQFPATPFEFTGDLPTRERALECLTTAIYYESASEGPQGEEAVAQVILNRVRSPSFPSSICSVVYQGSLLKTGCQFSFTCDGSLQRAVWKPEWLRARQIAEKALAGAVMPQVGLSTHYHTIDVVPYWATSLAKQVQVGRHIFYRWPGDWGRPAAFHQRYSGNEADPAMIRDTALLAKGIWPATMDGATQPEIQVDSDPKHEAAAIVELLGRAPAFEPGAFEAAARAYFSERPATPSADSPATGLERNDASGTASASTEGTATDAEDLAASSRMREFLRAHRRDYKAATVHAEQRLQRLAGDWQIYTGSTIGPQRVNLRLSNSLSELPCTTAPSTGTRALHAIAVEPADYDLFIMSGLPQALVTMRPPTRSGSNRALAQLIEGVRTDIVFAVFSRIAALSSGSDEQAFVLRLAAAEGHPLASIFAKRLEAFESNRVQYPTFSDFLPRLLMGLPLDQLRKTPTLNDANKCSWLNPASIASTTVASQRAFVMASRDLRP